MKNASMIDLNRQSQVDPVQREAYKQDEVEELSPMAPPEAYSPPASIEQAPYEAMAPLLQELMDEHKACLKELDAFEAVLLGIQNRTVTVDQNVHKMVSAFFRYFDKEIAIHNKKEEKTFFNLLHKRLIESGEHCKGDDKNKTAIDVLDADHSQFIQLAALSFNFFGMATHLPDRNSQVVVLDAAIEQGKALIEGLKLHIFREDQVVFQLAHQLLTRAELDTLHQEYLRTSTTEGIKI